MRNNRGQFKKGHTFRTKFIYNWNNLEKDYLRLGSMQAVADYIGCVLSTVNFHFKQQKLIILPHKSNSGSFKKGQKAWNEGTKGIMVAWNKGKKCSVETKQKLRMCNLGRKMSQLGIDKLRTYTGAKRYNWIGGGRNYYGDNWFANRKKALQRDNYICQSCGLSLNKMRRMPDVHHIIAFKNFITSKGANHLSNLITLCPSCHKKVETTQKGKFVEWTTNSPKEAIKLLNLKKESKLYAILSI